MPLHAAALAVLLSIAVAQSQAPPPPPPPPQGSPLAAAAAAAAAARGEGGDPGTGKPLAITFNWPVGMTAIVESERSRSQTMQGQAPKTTSMGVRYRMRVGAHRDGRVITYDGYEPMSGEFSQEGAAALEQALSTLMPSLIVSKTGEFLRVTDVAAMQKLMRELMGDLTEGGAQVPPNVKAMLDGMSSEEVLNGLASQEWQIFAGAWAGFEGRIGEMAEVDAEEPLPIMPGLTVPMRTSFGAVRQAPCVPGAAPDSCVIMQMRSSVAPGGMQALVQKLLEGAKGIPPVKFDRFDVNTDLKVTIEPRTARPHKITSARSTEFTFRSPEGQSASVSQVEQRNYRITYK